MLKVVPGSNSHLRFCPTWFSEPRAWSKTLARGSWPDSQVCPKRGPFFVQKMAPFWAQKMGQFLGPQICFLIYFNKEAPKIGPKNGPKN